MIVNRLHSIVIILMLSAQFLFATEEPGSIRGNVINKINGKPIANAKISLMQKNKVVELVSGNDDGTFILPKIPPGIYDLKCTYAGFIDQRIVGLTIRENHVKLAFFKLTYGDATQSGEDVILTHASIEILRAKAKVLSSKTGTSLADIPATMHVYTQEMIAERGYMHLSEVLADIPQLEINERSSFTDYNIISSRGIVGNEKLLILMNGVQISSMARTSHALDKAFPIKFAKRIEVILGPSSSSYAAEAFVGVVNIIMSDGRKQLGVATTGSYGMYNTTENAFFASFGKENVEVVVMGNFYQSDDSHMPSHYGSDYNWYNRNYQKTGAVLYNVFGNEMVHLNPTVYASPQRAYSVQAIANIYDFELGITHNSQSFSSATGCNSQYAIASLDNTTGFSTSNAYLKHTIGSSKRKSKGKAWNLESLVNWNYYQTNRQSTTQNVYTHYQKAYRFAFDSNVRIRETFTYDITPDKKPFKHQFLVGGYFRYTHALPQTSYLNKAFGKGNAVEQDLYYVGSNVMDGNGVSLKFIQHLYFTDQFNGGGFAQYGLKFKDLFSLTLGLQVDYVCSITQDALLRKSQSFNITPKATFVLKPNKNFRVKLFYAQAALMPSLRKHYEHYGTLDAKENGTTYLEGQTWRIPSDSLLNPEKLQSIETELSFTKGNLLLIANGYFSFGEDLIRDRRFYNKTFLENRITAISAVQAVNSAKEYLYGASVYASYQISAGKNNDFTFKVDASYSFADGETNGLEFIPFMARHTVKSGILLKYKFMSLSTRLIYRSASYNEGYEDEDGTFFQYGNEAYVVLNLFAKGTLYENKKTGLGIDAFVKINNLTNAQYYHVTENNPISMGAVPQSPIVVLGGINFRFLR